MERKWTNKPPPVWMQVYFIVQYWINRKRKKTARKHNFLCWLHAFTQILQIHSHTEEKCVSKFEMTLIWLRAYLFEVLIIKGDLSSSRLSNSWPVVWSLLVSYKETNQRLIRTDHRHRSWLKLSKHLKRNTERFQSGISLRGPLQNIFTLIWHITYAFI